MKALWGRLAARFDALASRERAMVGGGLLAAIVILGQALLIGPQLQRQAAAERRSIEAQTELTSVAAALAQAQATLKNPDQAKRARLLELRAASGAIDGRLRSLSGSMVSPVRMPAFLQTLLARNAKLELLSLRTLPPSPLIERNEAARPGEAANVSLPNVYKHGVEIRIGGSYGDLLAYLEELERMPQRILWSKLTLTAEQYPRSVLTLTVYTLSLDKQWLVV